MKRCCFCHQEKPLDQFYRSRRGSQGRQPQCKECSRRVSREWGHRNPERARAGWRRRRRGGDRRTPEQVKAHNAVNVALRQGRLHRPATCPRCGGEDSPIHAHHDDYSKPLDVVWLCARCHGAEHQVLA